MSGRIWLFLVSGVCACMLIPAQSRGDAANVAYIHDLENLLNSVESRDASRPQLTLKLADALFNEAISVSGEASAGDAQIRKATSLRRRSVQLYQEALTGLKRVFPLPSGNARAKIQFQLARLYSDLNDRAIAESIWQELAALDAMPDVQRESLLRLAETAENRPGRENLLRAQKDYQKALTLCSSQDVCSYTHYRLAWVLQRLEQMPQAIAEMNLALWDAKGQVREEALRDLVAFLGSRADDGAQSLEAIEKLSAKLNRPQLIGDLADAYFAHGQRKAGAHVLDAANRKQPSLKSYVRLMEEDYGFRDWDKFESELDRAVELLEKTSATKPDLETEKILRRLTVQLDGERATQTRSAEAFKRTVLFYLALFPERQERAQMIDGWLAAENDTVTKIARLKIWIMEEQKAGRSSEEIRLRKMRAAAAQKSQDYKVVIEEMTALEPQSKSAAQKTESAYQIAHAYYLNKDYVQALPRFKELAKLPSGNTPPDKWAVQSEHLALDILAQQKDFAAVVRQAQSWSNDQRFAGWAKTAKENKDELNDIKEVEISAEFEWATSLGAKPEALEVFSRDCLQNILLPKSCANAQVLAVQLGNQPTLISILRKLGKNTELAAELEASAEFLAAAPLVEEKLREKNAKPESRDHLKVALLYELGGSHVHRDRILHELIVRLGKQKTLGIEEDLLLQTLKEANLFTVGLLHLPWKTENREYLIDALVSGGQGTPALQKILTETCHDMGSAWQSNAWSELSKLNQIQEQIHFTGKASKRKFEARVAALKSLMIKGNCYLTSTTPQMRAVIATLLGRAQASLAMEIQASPIPEGVDEEGKSSLQKALVEMSQPFIDKAQEFEKLAGEQVGKVEDEPTRDKLKSMIAKTSAMPLTLLISMKTDKLPTVTIPPSGDVRQAALQELHKNPNQRSSLQNLKAYYESAGNPRLAAYFQGRLLQLGESQQ